MIEQINFIPDICDCGGCISIIYHNQKIGGADIHINNRHILINKFYINEEYREQKIGTALMNEIIKLCNKKRYLSATVRPSSGITLEMKALGVKGLTQEELIYFYEKFKFIKRGDYMYKKFKRFYIIPYKNIFC